MLHGHCWYRLLSIFHPKKWLIGRWSAIACSHDQGNKYLGHDRGQEELELTLKSSPSWGRSLGSGYKPLGRCEICTRKPWFCLETGYLQWLEETQNNLEFWGWYPFVGAALPKASLSQPKKTGSFFQKPCLSVGAGSPKPVVTVLKCVVLCWEWEWNMWLSHHTAQSLHPTVQCKDWAVGCWQWHHRIRLETSYGKPWSSFYFIILTNRPMLHKLSSWPTKRAPNNKVQSFGK